MYLYMNDRTHPLINLLPLCIVTLLYRPQLLFGRHHPFFYILAKNRMIHLFIQH